MWNITCVTIECFADPSLQWDFEQWIDTETKKKDKEYLRRMKEWDVERKELLEKRHKEEAAEKERQEEVERRHAA